MNSERMQLKSEIKDFADQGRKLRQEIAELKWKPEALAEVRATLALPSDKATGRKDKLKAWRRPETGPERSQLWNSKRDNGRYARHYLLAYGALRGLAYTRMEAKCEPTNKPSASWIRSIAATYLGKGSEGAAVWTEEATQAWLDGAESPFVWKRAEAPVQEVA